MDKPQKDNPGYIYSDINEVFEHLYQKGWSHVRTMAYAKPYFEEMQIEGNRYAYFPMPMHPLFRGQRRFYSPCKPSLYRKKWSETENLERLLQIEDFKHILDQNPEIIDLKQGGLYINYTGLAQHYGIETDMLDLTNSPLVAAFFATTEYDALKDEYRPVEDDISLGCIYFFPNGALFNGMFGETTRDIWPVGMEALRRPSEQRGYTMQLEEGQDFNNIGNRPFCFRFIQNREWSYRIFNALHGGKTLFPYDPMSEKVKIMREYRIYGLDSLRKVVSESPIQQSFDDARKLLEASGCKFLPTSPFRYTKEEMEYINEDYQKRFHQE